MSEEFEDERFEEPPEPEYDPDDDKDFDNFCELFEPVLREMAQVYAMHREEKGESWQEMFVWQIGSLFSNEILEYIDAFDCPAQHNELVDVLNLGFMLLAKLKKE